MNNIRQGDIFWIEFEDPRGSEPGYRHPCVVVQNNIFNTSRLGTTVVCVLTSNLERAKAPGNVLLKKGEGSLPKDSVVNVAQIITLDKTDLIERIGSLSEPRITQIVEGITLLLVPREL